MEFLKTTLSEPQVEYRIKEKHNSFFKSNQITVLIQMTNCQLLVLAACQTGYPVVLVRLQEEGSSGSLLVVVFCVGGVVCIGGDGGGVIGGFLLLVFLVLVLVVVLLVVVCCWYCCYLRCWC